MFSSGGGTFRHTSKTSGSFRNCSKADISASCCVSPRNPHIFSWKRWRSHQRRNHVPGSARPTQSGNTPLDLSWKSIFLCNRILGWTEISFGGTDQCPSQYTVYRKIDFEERASRAFPFRVAHQPPGITFASPLNCWASTSMNLSSRKLSWRSWGHSSSGLHKAGRPIRTAIPYAYATYIWWWKSQILTVHKKKKRHAASFAGTLWNRSTSIPIRACMPGAISRTRPLCAKSMMEAAVVKSLISGPTDFHNVLIFVFHFVLCCLWQHGLIWGRRCWWSLAAESLPPQPSTSWQRVPLCFTEFYFLAKGSRAKKMLQYRMIFSGKPTNSAVSSWRNAMHFLMLFILFHFLPVHTKLLFRATGTLALQLCNLLMPTLKWKIGFAFN